MSDIKLTIDGFANSLGSGKAALRHLNDAIDYVVDHSNDATTLAKMLDRAQSKGDNAAIKAVTSVIKAVWEGATITKSKGKAFSVKLKGSDFKADVKARLLAGVNEGISLRGTKLKELLKTVPGDDNGDPEPKTDDEDTNEPPKTDGPKVGDVVDFDSDKFVAGLEANLGSFTPEQLMAIARLAAKGLTDANAPLLISSDLKVA